MIIKTTVKQEVLANHDSDGDGKISRKEYTSHMFRLKIIIIIIIMMIIMIIIIMRVHQPYVQIENH